MKHYYGMPAPIEIDLDRMQIGQERFIPLTGSRDQLTSLQNEIVHSCRKTGGKFVIGQDTQDGQTGVRVKRLA